MSTDYAVVVLDRDLSAMHGDRVCRQPVRADPYPRDEMPGEVGQLRRLNHYAEHETA
jgi:hypothetical protein